MLTKIQNKDLNVWDHIDINRLRRSLMLTYASNTRYRAQRQRTSDHRRERTGKRTNILRILDSVCEECK